MAKKYLEMALSSKAIETTPIDHLGSAQPNHQALAIKTIALILFKTNLI